MSCQLFHYWSVLVILLQLLQCSLNQQFISILTLCKVKALWMTCNVYCAHTHVLFLYPHPLISHIHASHRGDMYITHVLNAIYETHTGTYQHCIYAFLSLFIDMSNGSSSSKYPATRKLFVGQNMAEQFLFSPQNLFSITCYSNPSKPKNFWKSFFFGGRGGDFFVS